MRKFGIFAFWSLLFSMMFLTVDGGDEGGGDDGDPGDEGGDIGDFDVGDGDPENGDEEGVITVPKEEWENVNSVVEEIQRRTAYESVISDIKADISDFDEGAVVKQLKEMHKKDPAKAETYNNEAGFKAIWYELQKKAAKNDEVNGGNNKGSGGTDFESVLDGAMKGKPGSLKQAISMAL